MKAQNGSDLLRLWWLLVAGIKFRSLGPKAHLTARSPVPLTQQSSRDVRINSLFSYGEVMRCVANGCLHFSVNQPLPVNQGGRELASSWNWAGWERDWNWTEHAQQGAAMYMGPEDKQSMLSRDRRVYGTRGRTGRQERSGDKENSRIKCWHFSCAPCTTHCSLEQKPVVFV